MILAFTGCKTMESCYSNKPISCVVYVFDSVHTFCGSKCSVDFFFLFLFISPLMDHFQNASKATVPNGSIGSKHNHFSFHCSRIRLNWYTVFFFDFTYIKQSLWYCCYIGKGWFGISFCLWHRCIHIDFDFLNVHKCLQCKRKKIKPIRNSFRTQSKYRWMAKSVGISKLNRQQIASSKIDATMKMSFLLLCFYFSP